MARPPATDVDQAFLREVDEELNRDEMRAKAQKYGPLLGGLAALVIVASGGWLYWQDQQHKEAAAQTEQFSQLMEDIGAGRTQSAPAKLDSLAQSDSDGVSAGARMARAALALEQNDRKAASALYQAVAADKGLAQPWRDLALLRATMVDYDTLRPDEVIARLQPLAQPGKPYFGSAGEMTGMALIAKGQKKEAGELFAKIAGDQSVPESLRARAAQVAGSLGVDASGALPAPMFGLGQ